MRQNVRKGRVRLKRCVDAPAVEQLDTHPNVLRFGPRRRSLHELQQRVVRDARQTERNGQINGFPAVQELRRGRIAQPELRPRICQHLKLHDTVSVETRERYEQVAQATAVQSDHHCPGRDLHALGLVLVRHVQRHYCRTSSGLAELCASNMVWVLYYG